MGYLNFIDDWNLYSRYNFERKLGKPQYIPEATLEDELCEGTWDFPCVAYIEDEDKYIALYISAITPKDYVDKGWGFTPKNGVICYAESKDGIHWIKPDMSEKVELDDRRTQNQVSGPFEGSPVLYDKWTSDSSAKFKVIYNYTLGGKECRALMVSPDGINWRHAETYPNIGASDSPTSLCYDPDNNCYYMYARKFNGDRRVWVWKTTDFKEFHELGLCMHPDPMDKAMVGFYGMPTFKYENMFFGLLWRIYCHQQTMGLANGPIDIGLTYSYDGSHFNRASYDAFIPRNPLGEHGGGCIYSSCMFVDKENTVRIYSGGSKAEHFQNQNLADAALMLHKLRLDGFMYLESVSRTANLRTKWLRITGDQLKINVKCPFGSARVQIVDENGIPLPGFTFDDCEPFTGDELFWQPQWKGGDLSNVISGRKRRQIDIEVVSGQVFAIRGDFEMLKSHHEKDD